MFFSMLWQPQKKLCLNRNVPQPMVQNFGLFKKIIITKIRKSNCLITIISLITTVKKILSLAWIRQIISAHLIFLFHHKWLTDFGPVFNFFDNFLRSLQSKRQLQNLTSYLLDHLNSAANQRHMKGKSHRSWVTIS